MSNRREAPAVEPRKLPYESPRLIEFGSLAELTQAKPGPIQDAVNPFQTSGG